VRLAVGTPSAGFRSPVYRLGDPSPPVGLLVSVPPRPLAPWTRAKGLQVAPLPQVALGGRRKKGDVGCTAPTDRLLQTPQKHQRTAGGVEEAGSQAQGTQRRVSPPPPPPSGPPSPPPPPPGGDLPQGHQQQQQPQRSPPLLGSLESPGPQVSAAPFSMSLIIMSTGLNSSSVH
jgi:hypothetical protein